KRHFAITSATREIQNVQTPDTAFHGWHFFDSSRNSRSQFARSMTKFARSMPNCSFLKTPFKAQKERTGLMSCRRRPHTLCETPSCPVALPTVDPESRTQSRHTRIHLRLLITFMGL